MKPVVIVNIPVNGALRQRMRDAAPNMEFYFIERNESCAQLKDASILFGVFGAGVFKEAPRLKWLQVLSSGIDWFMKPGILPEGVTLTSATGSYGDTISEFMLANTLSLAYRLHQYRDRQNAKEWSFVDYPLLIKGCTALILGLGDIGSCYARRLKELGAYTIGVRRAIREKPDFVDELYTFDEPNLDALFPRADVIAMCMPGTPQTANMLSKPRIDSLKRSSIIVNVGRGSAIDEAALATALIEGRVHGAALDVFEKEPLPQASPLWGLDNIIITPHVAGHDLDPHVLKHTIELFFDNLAAFQEGRALKNVVDRQTQYAKK